MLKWFRFSLLVVTIIISIFTVAILATCSESDDTGAIAIIHTDFGEITIDLYDDKTPNTVENFVRLAQDGFYDGLSFYRISDDFMIQAGANGQKLSPYGPINLEIHTQARHIDGAISMARMNDPNSASSEFFITDGLQPHLDDLYAVFGIVTSGLEVVHEIAAQPHDNLHPAGGGAPLTPIVIKSIEIQGID